MARNGSGTFTRSNGYYTGSGVWGQDRDNGVKIVASRHDAHDQDIANAITASIANDGQTPIVADLPMSGYKHSNVGNATGRTQYAAVNQVQDNAYNWGGTSGGSASAYTISLAPAITAYVDGLIVVWKAHTASGAGATLAVNGLAAKGILCEAGATAIAADGIASQEIVICVYHSASGGYFQVASPMKGKANEITVAGSVIKFPSSGVILPNTSADQPLYTDGSGKVVSATSTTFRNSFSIARSGANEDITSIVPSGTTLGLGASGAVAWTIEGVAGGNRYFYAADNKGILGQSPSVALQTIYSRGIQGAAGEVFTVKAQTGYGTVFVVNGSDTILTMRHDKLLQPAYLGGNSAKSPASDAIDDWLQIVDPSGNNRYIPLYAAS